MNRNASGGRKCAFFSSLLPRNKGQVTHFGVAAAAGSAQQEMKQMNGGNRDKAKVERLN
jgi:hypothetical protein